MDSPTYLPSVNLEFDFSRLDQLPRFRFTSKNLYLLRQFVTTLNSLSAERAWSIVGPYGSGKSMFALLLASLFGSIGESDWSKAALADLDEIDPNLSQEIRESRNRGSLELVSVGSGEGVVVALLDGLSMLLEDVQAAAPCKDHKAFLALASKLRHKREIANPADVGRLLDLAARCAKRLGRSGLLVVFDEFGRTIERGLNMGELIDMQAIQEIAEASNRSQGYRIHLLVLLHQSFESYATGISRRHRMEWAKVQGRFRQISFIEEPEAVLSSVADILNAAYTAPDPAGWLQSEWSIVKEMPPFRDEAPFWLEMIPRLFPLGAVAAYVLPRLSSLAGQNERSVHAFLSSEDPGALPSRIAALDNPSQGIRVDELCDYFLLSGRSAYLDPRVQARLAELLVAIEKTDDDLKTSIVKVIATLAMIGGPLWPTQGAIASALGISSNSQEWGRIEDALKSLSERRVIVHRRYSGEYHLWRGTDLDIGFALEEKRLDLSAEFELASFLNERVQLVPYVARRTTYETGTPRLFARRFISVEEASHPESLNGLFKDYSPIPDGMVLYLIASAPEDKVKAKELGGTLPASDERPIIFVLPGSSLDISDLALDIRALSILEKDLEVNHDPVALAEISLRMRACESIVKSRLTDVIQPTGSSEWIWARSRVRLSGQRELQEFLSTISDEVYMATPFIRNELINRHHISTAVVVGVKKIIAGLLQEVRADHLGFKGNGPEVSIFNAVFEQTGWYRANDEHPALGPSIDSPTWANQLWFAIEQRLVSTGSGRASIADVLEILSAPPFGIRAGLAPLLVWSVLIANRNSLCLYERGTYLTEWDVELYDRMVRSPQNFEVNTLTRLPNAEDPLPPLFKAVPPYDEAGSGLNTLLQRLFGWYKALPEFSRRTQHVSEGSKDLRRLLSAARDPIDMLFHSLPAALNGEGAGFSDMYVESLKSVILELDGAYRALQTDLIEALAEALQCDMSVRSLRTEFTQLWDELRDSALDMQAKAFLLRGADENLQGEAWLESVAASVIGKSPRFWLDNEVEEFKQVLVSIAHSIGLTRRAATLRRGPRTGQKHVSLVTADGTLVDDVVEHVSDPALEALAKDLIERLSSLPQKQRRNVAVALLAEAWKDAKQ